MTSPRLAYDDAAPTREMVEDCRASLAGLHLGRPLHALLVADPTPPPAAAPRVSAELARRAGELELHLG